MRLAESARVLFGCPIMFRVQTARHAFGRFWAGNQPLPVRLQINRAKETTRGIVVPPRRSCRWPNAVHMFTLLLLFFSA